MLLTARRPSRRRDAGRRMPIADCRLPDLAPVCPMTAPFGPLFPQGRRFGPRAGGAYAAGMKAVLLAGGLGTRIAPESHLTPKPMIEIGGRPILWHIMK